MLLRLTQSTGTTSGETEDDHLLTTEVQDAAGNIGQSAAVTATVANMVQFAVALSGVEEVPASDSQATAQAFSDG